MTPDELMTALDTARRRRQQTSNRSLRFNNGIYTWGRVGREIGIPAPTLALIRARKYVGPDVVTKCQAWIAGVL